MEMHGKSGSSVTELCCGSKVEEFRNQTAKTELSKILEDNAYFKHRFKSGKLN